LTLYSRHGLKATGRTEPYPNDPVLFEVEMFSICLGERCLKRNGRDRLSNPASPTAKTLKVN
ncbi:MAG: hypothetical protein M3Z09_18635, partial [Acidobacteriota bacterium]|nr:hypothetical protein [Acidobacteriota bacterium]